jgi:hypothetical protein
MFWDCAITEETSMAYHRGLGAEAVYAAARRVVDAGLRTDGSVFTPEAAIWTLDRAEDL